MWRFINELRSVSRSLRRRPLLPVLLVLVVAVGIAFLTTTYAVFDAILWKPLEIGSQSRYVMLGEVARDGSVGQMPSAGVDLYAAYARAHAAGRVPSAESFIPLREREVNLVVEGVGGAEMATWLRPHTFPHLESTPVLGRFPSAETSRHREIAIGEAIWERRFGRSRAVIGAAVELDGDSAVVVGVMPRRFQFHRMSELWVAWSEAELFADPTASIPLVVKFARGSDYGDLSREISPVMREVFASRTPPDTLRRGSLSPGPFGAPLVPYQLARLILAMTILVLMAACVNVAVLFMVRVRGRGGEFATLAALGARRADVVGRVVGEVALITFAGGALALLLSWSVVRWLNDSMAGTLPAWVDISVDLRAFTVTGATIIGAMLLVAYPAARLAGRLDLARLLTHSGVIGGTPKHGRVKSALIALQVAVVVFLGAATLPIAHAAIALSGVRSGLDEDRVVTVRVNTAGAAQGESAAQHEYVEKVRAHLLADSRIEGVAAAGRAGVWVSGEPQDYSQNWFVEGRVEPLPFLTSYRTSLKTVSRDYFSVVGLRLIEGELFDSGPYAAESRVAVVSRSVAEGFWPGESAVGRRFATSESAPWIRVIGVVQNEEGIFADWRGTTFEPHKTIHLSDAQASMSFMEIHVRADSVTPGLMASVERGVAGVDPTRAVFPAQQLGHGLAVERSVRKWFALILGSGVVAALLMAIMGVYGVVTYYTNVRLRELALRVALGSQRRAAALLVARDTLRSVARGCVFGLAFLLVCARPFIARFEYEASMFSPLSLLCVALLVLTVAGCALAPPMFRLRSTSPHELLRPE